MTIEEKIREFYKYVQNIRAYEDAILIEVYKINTEIIMQMIDDINKEIQKNNN